MGAKSKETIRYGVDPISMRAIPEGRNFLIMGKRNTGKTVLLGDLIFHRQKMEFGMAIAGSVDSLYQIRKYHPDTFIFQHFNEDLISNFFNKVKKLNGKMRRRHLEMVDCYLILDDTGFDQTMWQSTVLREIMQNGRQYNLSLFICMQYGKALHPNMRSQIDYAFILKEKAPEMLNKIYDCFAGGHYPDKQTFRAVLHGCTLSYKCMVIRNADVIESDGDFEGGVYFYKAKKEHKPFTVGCDAMWRYHFRKYNNHYETDEENGKTAVQNLGNNNIKVVCKRKARKKRGG